jgi:putative transposase
MQLDVEKLRRWCIRRKLQGWKVAEICHHARISRTSFYRYWNRYEKHGFDGLKTRSRRPHTIHRKDDTIVQKVPEIRTQEQYCPQRIAGILKRQGLLTIGHMTVYRILCRHGLNKPLSQPRVKRKYRSFQKDHPNEMWQQIDLKIVNSKWMVSILDDHSRYILASAITRHATTARSIIDLVRQAIKLYGKPEQILTDHGRQFYNPYSESDFDGFCKKQSIEHVMG